MPLYWRRQLAITVYQRYKPDGFILWLGMVTVVGQKLYTAYVFNARAVPKSYTINYRLFLLENLEEEKTLEMPHIRNRVHLNHFNI